jgi:hypothetical protein
MLPTYCTRDDVKSALDIQETARANEKIDRHVQSASRAVDSLCHRVFYPHYTTRYFEWPDPNRGRAWRLWFNQHDVISITDLGVRGGASLPVLSYLLEPVNSGPPFTHVEIDTSAANSGSFGGAAGSQRAVRLTGWFGYQDEQELVCELAAPAAAGDTTITVSNGTGLGYGSTLVIGAERVIVTGKTLADTGATLAGNLTASLAQTGVTVSDASLLNVGETLLINTERVVIDDIAGNLLLVRRGVDGSVLAAHTGSVALYAPRFLSVERAALGTSATVHNTTDPVSRVVYPGLVRDLAIAEALNGILQDASGWARTAGSGDNEREASGKGIRTLRDDCYWKHGRQARKMAI